MSRTLLFILFLSFILTGCMGRRSIPSRYYIIEYLPGTELTISDDRLPIQASCLIRTVEISPVYATTQIALQERTHEIRYFAFNHWAVRPEQSFTSLVTRFMNDHNIFRTIHFRSSFTMEADYIMETTIHQLVLVEEGNDYFARISLDYTLRNFDNDEVISVHRADRKEIIEEKNLNLFASVISRLFVEELENFIMSILKEIS
jgi:ABC-type uncharacterized transport system auxiliary subunit